MVSAFWADVKVASCFFIVHQRAAFIALYPVRRGFRASRLGLSDLKNIGKTHHIFLINSASIIPIFCFSLLRSG